MMKIIILAYFCCLINIAYGADGVTWALLVAGSNEYMNYRHQADVCHSYQVLHNHGIDDDHIIVMMYDDIATNRENPTKGKIINKPNGPDVYGGVPKDYTKKTVTPKNFLNILQGKSAVEGLEDGIASGKTINSGPNDNIFVFFSDHGAPGIVAFPSGAALHAKDLNAAIKDMYTQQKFKNMVIYIEACEAGSMFEGLLPNNINVYATTASNATESSYACYWDDKYQAYLGDVYSVNWMEDSDKEDLTKETFSKQYQLVQKETNTSNVMQYGDITFAPAHFLSEFQGNKTSSWSANSKPDYEAILRDAVPIEHVKLATLERRLRLATTDERRREIEREIETLNREYRLATMMLRELPSVIFANIPSLAHKMLNNREKLTNHECYAPAVDHMTQTCFDLNNEHFLKNLYIVVNLCEHGVSSERIQGAVDILCKHKQKFL